MIHCLLCCKDADEPDDGLTHYCSQVQEDGHATCKEVYSTTQNEAIHRLKRDQQPAKCRRCGGKPGDPGCGKTIHILLDEYFEWALDDLWGMGRVL